MSNNATEKILYVGYGANRDPNMVSAITGDTPNVIGNVAIHDVELCLQQFEQITDNVADFAPSLVSPKQIISNAWGDNGDFKTYAIRPKIGSKVSATLYELTALQRDLIADWELIEFGWYNAMTVTVELDDGQKLQAKTEGFTSGQEIDRVSEGQDYETFLVDPVAMRETAEKARLEYLERLAQTIG